MRIIPLLEEVLGRGVNTSRTDIAFVCPFCNKGNQAKRKLEVDIESQHWHCWVCNSRGRRLIDLFKKIGVSSKLVDALTSIVSTPTATLDTIGDILNRRETTSIVSSLSLPSEYIPLYRAKKTVEFKNAMYYLKRRDILPEQIIRYQIGYCEDGEYSRRLVIPSYDLNGQLNYFVTRSYYDESTIRYKNPDVSKNIIPFDLHINWSLPLVICEGLFDAIAIRRNALPILGKTISDAIRIRILESPSTTIYIALDPDAIKHALIHAKHFMDQGHEVHLLDLGESDPSELGFNGMMRLIKDSKPMTFKDLILHKL